MPQKVQTKGGQHSTAKAGWVGTEEKGANALEKGQALTAGGTLHKLRLTTRCGCRHVQKSERFIVEQ